MSGKKSIWWRWWNWKGPKIMIVFDFQGKHGLTVPLFPELRGNFDDELAMSCIRIHSTHCCSVGTGEVVEVPPNRHTKHWHKTGSFKVGGQWYGYRSQNSKNKLFSLKYFLNNRCEFLLHASPWQQLFSKLFWWQDIWNTHLVRCQNVLPAI